MAVIYGSGEDCLDAGAFVSRYNTYLNIAVALQNHATKTQGAGSAVVEHRSFITTI